MVWKQVRAPFEALRRFENRVGRWAVDHPREMRVISSVAILGAIVYNLVVAVTGPGGPFAYMQLVLVAVFVVAYVALVRSWRRHDACDSLRELVVVQTDNVDYGHIAWGYAYTELPTRMVREMNTWLERNDLSRHPRDDMPPAINRLVDVLIVARWGQPS